METGSELCLREEVVRMREAGLSAEEISQEIGVDPGWVEEVLSVYEPAGRGDHEPS